MSGLANKERAPQSISHNMDGVTPVTHLFDVITGERIDLLEPQISHVDAVMQAERQRGRVDQQPPAAPGVTPTGTGK